MVSQPGLNISWSKLREYAVVATSSVTRSTSRTRRTRRCFHPVGAQHVGNPTLPRSASRGCRTPRHIHIENWFLCELNAGPRLLPRHGQLSGLAAGPGNGQIGHRQPTNLRTGRAAIVELGNCWGRFSTHIVGFYEGPRAGLTLVQLPLEAHTVRGGRHDGGGRAPPGRRHPYWMTRRPWYTGHCSSYPIAYGSEAALETFGSRIGQKSSNRPWDHSEPFCRPMTAPSK